MTSPVDGSETDKWPVVGAIVGFRGLPLKFVLKPMPSLLGLSGRPFARVRRL